MKGTVKISNRRLLSGYVIAMKRFVKFPFHPYIYPHLTESMKPHALPLPLPPPFSPLQGKLEGLSHHPRFSSNLVGSKVASWAGEGSRWLHAQGGPRQRPFRF